MKELLSYEMNPAVARPPRNRVTPKSFATKTEIGGAGVNMYGGQVYESRLRNLRGAKRNVIIRDMAETDGIVKGCISAFKLLAKAAERTVNPGGDSAADEEAAEFIDECLTDMEITWEDTLSSAFSFLEFGFAPLEVVYKQREDGRIGWHKWAIRPQDTIDRWIMDDNQNVKGLWQRLENSKKGQNEVAIPVEKLLIFRTTHTGNPEGQSILEAAYRDWFKKRYFEDLEAVLVKRDLTGMLTLSFPKEEEIWASENIDKLRKAEELVTHLDAGEYMGLVKPENVTLELMRSPGQRSINLEELYKRINLSIAFATFTEFMLVGHEEAGSWALKREGRAIFNVALQGYMDGAASIINRHAIPKLIGLNEMKVTEPPWISFGTVDVPTVTEVTEFLKVMSEVGFTVAPSDDLQKHLYARMRLPEPEPEDELTREEEGKEKPEEVEEEETEGLEEEED